MFENRILANGSAYLAKTLFTDIRPRQKSVYNLLVAIHQRLSMMRVFDARASMKLIFKLLYFGKLGKKFS